MQKSEGLSRADLEEFPEIPEDLWGPILSRETTDWYDQEVAFTAEEIRSYTQLSGDINPIHFGAHAIVPGGLIGIAMPRFIPLYNPLINCGLLILENETRGKSGQRYARVGDALRGRMAIPTSRKREKNGIELDFVFDIRTGRSTSPTIVRHQFLDLVLARRTLRSAKAF